MSFTAFQPSGNTALIIASSSTAGTPTQVSTGGMQGMWVVNASTASQYAYVAVGQTSAIQALVASTSAPATGLAIPPGQGKNITTPPGAWLSAATSAGSCNVFATPGAFGS